MGQIHRLKRDSKDINTSVRPKAYKAHKIPIQLMKKSALDYWDLRTLVIFMGFAHLIPFYLFEIYKQNYKKDLDKFFFFIKMVVEVYVQ